MSTHSLELLATYMGCIDPHTYKSVVFLPGAARFHIRRYLHGWVIDYHGETYDTHPHNALGNLHVIRIHPPYGRTLYSQAVIRLFAAANLQRQNLRTNMHR